MKNLLLCAIALLTLVSQSEVLIGQDAKLPGLLSRSPAPANAVVYLNVPSLKKLMTEADMPASLSDAINEIWAISDLNTASFTPNWEAGYATLSKSVDAAALATATQGYVDTVQGQPAVWTKSQSYLVPVGENKLGFLRPAKRTLLADWLQPTAKGMAVGDYLSAQAKRSETYLSFMLAVDLEDTFSPVPMESRLQTFESLKGKDTKSIGRLLASVKGVSIIVGRRSLQECILAVEFGESPAALNSVAVDLLNEILNRNGTGAPEVTQWKSTVEGNTLSFQGAISADTLDGVLGIFSLRGQAEAVASSMDRKKEEDPTSLMAYASKKYFDDVNAYIERVRKYKAQSTGYRAKWNEQHARRIEELGTLHVDPQMIDYGANVANMLRGNATMIRSGNVAAGQAMAANSVGGYGYGGEGYSYGGYYNNGYNGGYGYQNAYSEARSQNAIGASQRMAGFGSFQEALAAIDKLTAETRRAMTAKYELQF